MNLDPLKRAVDEAVAEDKRPPREGETKYVRPLSDYLGELAWQLVWQVVRALRHDHPFVFVRFAETTLASLVIDELAAFGSTPSLEALADRLQEVAASEGPWLVSTPLSNIVTRQPAVKLAEEVVLWRAILGTDWMDERFSGGDDDNSTFAVHDFLGDRLPRVTRWLRFSSGDRLDTGVGAQLLTVERGTATLALARARARAQYALAVWAILAPPEGWKVLPDVANWVPQPSVQLGQRFKEREHETWTPRARTRGNFTRHWSEYEAPEDELLRIPFAAMERLERRSAQALLSASLAHFQASRGSRFLLSERVRSIHVAIECLCEPQGAQGSAFDRWSALTQRFEVWAELSRRGYDPEDARVLQERLKNVRNIATHGVDAALVDLGYPEDQPRKLRGKNRFALGRDLAVAAVQSDLAPLVFAVRFALEKLFLLMRNGWSDEIFEEQFKSRAC